jgi:hypothetical protein
MVSATATGMVVCNVILGLDGLDVGSIAKLVSGKSRFGLFNRFETITDHFFVDNNGNIGNRTIDTTVKFLVVIVFFLTNVTTTAREGWQDVADHT